MFRICSFQMLLPNPDFASYGRCLECFVGEFFLGKDCFKTKSLWIHIPSQKVLGPDPGAYITSLQSPYLRRYLDP